MMAMLKAPEEFIKGMLYKGNADEKVEAKEDEDNRQFSPEFEALLKEYEKKDAVISK